MLRQLTITLLFARALIPVILLQKEPSHPHGDLAYHD